MKRLFFVVALTAATINGNTAGAAEFNASEQSAIFAAAGFKKSGATYVRCKEDPPTLSYSAGRLEPADVNGDGQLDVWVREGSVFCYGNTGEFFVLLTRDKKGHWVKLLESVGIAVVLEKRRSGWPDIEVGGPGRGPFPVYAFNGKVYKRR